MPITKLQDRILALLAENRKESSHLAGAVGIHLAPSSPRRSSDLDLFHDSERAVADAFEADRRLLETAGCTVQVYLSQPGFVRAIITDQSGSSIRMDWAQDSAWRFLPPVRLERAGYVLHPVDLAVNKVLALAGRDEPRDFVDILYLDRKVLPLGALIWAAAGKDAGLNPAMLTDLLSRKGRYRQEDFDRLDLALPFDAAKELPCYRRALDEGRAWIGSRPAEEMGCLYRRPRSRLFFAPQAGEAYEVHRGALGGVMPMPSNGLSFAADPVMRKTIESFFERRVVKE